MSSSPEFEHQQLFHRFVELDELSEDKDAFISWIAANGHLKFLCQDILKEELAIHAMNTSTFMQTAIVSEEWLCSVDRKRLLHWESPDKFGRVGYAYNADDVWLENPAAFWDLQVPESEAVQSLVYCRSGEHEYLEILQEYLHTTNIHWHEGKKVFCRFDEYGDHEHIVSIVFRQGEPPTTLVSFKREPLDQFLAVSKTVLVRMYAFMLLTSDHGWPQDPPPEIVMKSRDLFCQQQVVPGHGAWARGVQIVQPSQPRSKIYASIRGESKHEYVDFTAWDWRNGNQEAIISTDPQATTNYFTYHSNSLPFEISPVFFDPEVLRRYKSDHDKYPRIGPCIQCRDAWSLRYHVNEARQIQVYIKDLRNLPLREQQYWKSFNEKCKGGMAQSAWKQDFLAQWSSTTEPLGEVLGVIRCWTKNKRTWWKLADEQQLERISTPLTDSLDEWGNALLELANLVVGGFRAKAIRATLTKKKIHCEEDRKDQSLYLLETLLTSIHKSGQRQNLSGLREIQKIRSKVAAHWGGQEAQELKMKALSEHGTFTAHFESLCGQAADELKQIEKAFSQSRLCTK